MTSRNSFFSIMKQDLKNRLWTIVLASVTFFFCLPVAVMFVIQTENAVSIYSMHVARIAQIQKAIIRLLGCGSILMTIVAVVGAVFTSLNGFFYLFSKQKVDLVHSLPVRREKLFAVKYIDGVLIYLVPYLAGMIITFIIMGITGVMNLNLAGNLLFGIMINLLGYLLVYTTIILASMLAGNAFIATVMSLILMLYSSVIYLTVEWCNEYFFSTLYNSNEIDLLNIRLTSPLLYYISMVEKAAENYSFIPAKMVICAMLMIAVLIVLTLMAYRKRKSEAAGGSIAFKIAEPIIRYLCTIPAGIFLGMFFMELTSAYGNNDSIIWLFFGVICGVVLVHGVIQSVYEHDVRKFLSKRAGLGISVAAALLITCVYAYDLLGVDSYIPKKDRISSMAVSINRLNYEANDYYSPEGKLTSLRDYELQNMEIKDIDAAYSLAEKCVELNRKGSPDVYVECYDSSYEDCYDVDYIPAEKQYTNIQIRYNLKNGRKVTRNYYVDMNVLEDDIRAVYDSEEYRETHFVKIPFELLGSGGVEISYDDENNYVLLTSKQVNELFSAYFSEAENMTYDMFKNREIVCEIAVEIRSTQQWWYSEYFYVYSFMEETIKLLQSYGYLDLNKT